MPAEAAAREEVPSATERYSSLLSALRGVDGDRVAQVWEALQKELHARSERDRENRELELTAERQAAELELQRATFDAEQARQQVELELQRTRFEAEEARLQAEMKHQAEIHAAEAKREPAGERIRGLVLLVVIFAVLLTPMYAMIRRIPPDNLIQYVAPITGITGTVLGYWFGRQDPR